MYTEMAAGFQVHFRCAVLGEPIVRKHLLCFVACFLSTTLLAAAPPAPTFRAGAATSNITPALGSAIIGGFLPFPATNVHDELQARCLVLDDGKTKLALVVLDCCCWIAVWT